MTHNEIVQSYKNAANQHYQLEILSQLTLESVGTIINILERNGIEVKDEYRKPYQKRDYRKWRKETIDEVRRLHKSRYTNRQISEMTNLPYESVHYLTTHYCGGSQRLIKWTEERNAELLRLRDKEGLTFVKIAEIIGGTQASVSIQYRKYKKRQKDSKQ